jgi:hypothetical protein
VAETLDWRIWYGDGTTFDSLDGSPKEAPARGVVCIAVADPDLYGNGSYVHHLYDFYVLEKERWKGVDLFGLYDFLLDSGLVKFGRMIPSGTYRQIIWDATHDPDFKKMPMPKKFKELKWPKERRLDPLRDFHG